MNHELLQEIRELNHKLDRARELYLKVTQENDQLRAQYDRLECDLKLSREEVERLRLKLDNSILRRNQACKERDSLEKQVQDQKVVYTELQGEFDSLTSEYDNVCARLEDNIGEDEHFKGDQSYVEDPCEPPSGYRVESSSGVPGGAVRWCAYLDGVANPMSPMRATRGEAIADAWARFKNEPMMAPTIPVEPTAEVPDGYRVMKNECGNWRGYHKDDWRSMTQATRELAVKACWRHHNKI